MKILETIKVEKKVMQEKSCVITACSNELMEVQCIHKEYIEENTAWGING